MPRLVSERLRGLPRDVWVLLAGTLITRAGSFAIPFLTVYLHRDRGLSTAFAGLALAAWGAGGMVASLTGGALADRLGRKPVVVGSPVLGGLAVALLVTTQAPVAVLAGAFLAGAVSESGRPAVSAMLTDLTPPARRVDAFALFRLVVNLGFAVGAGLGGVLATHVGFGPLFLADAATSWIYAVIALLALRETRPGATERPAERSGFAAVLADPVFRRLWLATLVSAFVFTQPMAVLGLVLADRGMSTVAYGLLISLNGVIIITTEFWLSGVVRRHSPPRMLALGALLIGAGFALTGLVGTSVVLLVLTVGIWTTGEMVGSPTSQAYLSAIAPPDQRGRYHGMFGLSWSVAFAVGPVLGGLALTAGGPVLWLGSLALSVLGAVLYLGLPAVSLTGEQPGPGGTDVVPLSAPARAVGGRLVGRLARPRS